MTALPAAAVPRPRRVHAQEALGGLHAAVMHQLICVATIVVLILPALTPAAAVVRFTFPAAAAIIAGALCLRGRSASYVSFCLWLFILTPFVRRLVDQHAGYSQANILMLAPYLATAWCWLYMPKFFGSRSIPIQLPIAGVMAATLYGYLISVADGRLLPATVDLLRWSTPPVLACYLIANPDKRAAIWREVSALALVALPIVGLYGIYQFVSPPLWDTIWMNNTKMTSIGWPRPFEVRVFSTMNSPASLSFYLVGLMLVVLTLRTQLRWIGAALGAAALGVSLVRSAWLGLVIGIVVLMVRATPRIRISILALIFGAAALAPLALTNARTEALVTHRMDTLFRVGHDKSYTDRKAGYVRFADELGQKPWGQGLGIANAAANYTNNARVVDGGPIEIFLSLGLVVGAIYTTMLFLVLFAVVRRPRPAEGRDLHTAAGAIVFVQLLEITSATTVVGEIGIVFWLFAGLVLSAPGVQAARAAWRPAVIPHPA